MKPVSTHTIKRFVWISLVTSNGSQVFDRIGPEILHGRKETERHLQTVEQHRDNEIRVGNGLGTVAHQEIPLT